MRVKRLDSIAPGNPFLSDMAHMGITMGTNVMVMHIKHSSEVQPYLIIVDTTTGERIRIDLTPTAEKEAARGLLLDKALKEGEV